MRKTEMQLLWLALRGLQADTNPGGDFVWRDEQREALAVLINAVKGRAGIIDGE